MNCGKCKENSWYEWGQEIRSEVEAHINDKDGDRINPYYDCNDFADYLLHDISLLPLWSNIYAEHFGFPGVNPSSAAVEQVFRKIKNTALPKKLPMRVDIFVQEHLKYLNGKVKLISDGILKTAEEHAKLANTKTAPLSLPDDRREKSLCEMAECIPTMPSDDASTLCSLEKSGITSQYDILLKLN